MMHYVIPSPGLFIALKAINVLYQLKMWLLRRERRRLQAVLVQIAQEKAALLAEEQDCHDAHNHLTGDEQAVQKGLRRYLTKM